MTKAEVAEPFPHSERGGRPVRQGLAVQGTWRDAAEVLSVKAGARPAWAEEGLRCVLTAPALTTRPPGGPQRQRSPRPVAGRTRGRERRQGDSDLEGASSGRWRGWESGRGRRRRRVRSPRCRVRDAQETRAPAQGGMLRASRPPRARAWVDTALGGPGVGPRLRLGIEAWMGGGVSC